MIQTGKLPISALTFWAIMSLSLVVNLPGLAVTPMLGNLEKIFPETTQLEEQLLTILPNLLIIPFVLLSGRLSLTKHKVAVVIIALGIYSACGIAYLFADSILQLIVVSCLLGCGAGLIIPFAAGFIADTFAGKYRMKQMGLKSAISNISLVVATFVVGWLSHGDWHLPFAVYLIALIPLALSFGLRGISGQDLQGDLNIPVEEKKARKTGIKQPDTKDGFYLGRLFSTIGIYVFITFATVGISYYCPFLVEKDGWSSTLTGTITSLYFLFIFLPGLFLTPIVKIFKSWTMVAAFIFMTIGIGLFAFVEAPWAMCVGGSLAGLGYGICQPLIYNKGSRCVTSDDKATLSLALVLSSNYIAIVITPFIIDFCRTIFKVAPDGTFAFLLCFVLLVVMTVVAFFCRNTFGFSVAKDFYS